VPTLAALIWLASVAGAAPPSTPAPQAHRPPATHDPHADPGPGPGPHDATSHRRFDDVEYWTGVFDDPQRDAWQKPDALVRALALPAGAWVADLGAGTGYLLRRLAEAVGPAGTVFAVEVEPNLVAHLRQRAERERLAQVVPVLASFDDPRLPRAAFDCVLVLDTYHHIDDRLAYFRRLRAALKAAGRVVIVDWHKQPLPVGPAPDHKLAREQVVDEMGQAGYRLVAESDALPYQYFLAFQPSGTGDAP
jgi:ubiquinone/menaquinone biosynthesis C-methylase UbiE